METSSNLPDLSNFHFCTNDICRNMPGRFLGLYIVVSLWNFIKWLFFWITALYCNCQPSLIFPSWIYTYEHIHIWTYTLMNNNRNLLQKLDHYKLYMPQLLPIFQSSEKVLWIWLPNCTIIDNYTSKWFKTVHVDVDYSTIFFVCVKQERNV